MNAQGNLCKLLVACIFWPFSHATEETSTARDTGCKGFLQDASWGEDFPSFYFLHDVTNPGLNIIQTEK